MSNVHVSEIDDDRDCLSTRTKQVPFPRSMLYSILGWVLRKLRHKIDQFQWDHSWRFIFIVHSSYNLRILHVFMNPVDGWFNSIFSFFRSTDYRNLSYLNTNYVTTYLVTDRWATFFMMMRMMTIDASLKATNWLERSKFLKPYQS
jgi:hypothetical protein